MSAVPKGWESVVFAEVVTLKTGPFGSALHKSDYVTGGVPLINPSHIREGRLEPDRDISVDASAHARLGVCAAEARRSHLGQRR
jgi:type I restriction enzyme, S subunit